METAFSIDHPFGINAELGEQKPPATEFPNEVSPFSGELSIHACNPEEMSPEALDTINALSPFMAGSVEPELLNLEGVDIPAAFFFSFYTSSMDPDAENSTPETVILQRAAEHLSHYVNVSNSDMFAHLCSLYNIFQLDEEVFSLSCHNSHSFYLFFRYSSQLLSSFTDIWDP